MQPPPVSRVSEIRRSSIARRLVKWLAYGVGGLIGLVVLILLAVIFWPDAPPPEDGEMIPVFTEGGGPNNPLVEFVKNAPNAVGVGLLSEEAKELRVGSEPELREHLKRNENLLNAWDKLVQSDRDSWRWRLQDSALVSRPLEFEGWQKLQDVCNLDRCRIVLLVRDGRLSEAAEKALALIASGEALFHAEGDGMDFLVSSTVKSIGVSCMEEVLIASRNDGMVLTDLQAKMSRLEGDCLSATKHMLQVEYLTTKKILNNWDEYLAAGLKRRRIRSAKWLIDVNRSLNIYIEFQRPLLVSASKDTSTLSKAAIRHNYARREWRPYPARFLSLNFFGDHTAHDRAGSLNLVVDRGIRGQFWSTAMPVIIALRRHELEKGKLPVDLEKLVPEYLPKVPLDPYDGAPLRWNLEKKRLYSVCSNGKDDGGDFGRPMMARFEFGDLGLFYLWGEEYKAYHRKLYAPLNELLRRR
ncbi:hypothetical protein FEM03_22520 [Phragmitibacter flavus]|uniref:Uncharacterized protein n=1 Tax=Phragmitibacter flavus TaxID=2576071 RepID=A0A5R8K832_9BACT|nr:hypothetical protein [Phragmitibacter flavus]TLD68481.1 hypothetical protein FEM03_22520 [Phragmitibacter flavus]